MHTHLHAHTHKHISAIQLGMDLTSFYFPNLMKVSFLLLCDSSFVEVQLCKQQLVTEGALMTHGTCS